tara:strand:+ start:6473 stop:6595 length:123 start_codon:yes stop_codon:yes gene_type:complete
MGSSISYEKKTIDKNTINNESVLHQSGYYDNWQYFKGYDF